MTNAKFSEAQTLYGTAREMRAAAETLSAHPTGGFDFIGTVQFLLGFSTELFLKATLAQAEVPPKYRHGHDLLSLRWLANEIGLLNFINAEAFNKVVDFLAPAHKEYSWRYTKPDSDIQILTSVGPALAVLASLDDHLRKDIYP